MSAPIRVSEIYGPVRQGEGALLGEAMPFVRVAGCNLSCSWCDSRFTWEPGYRYTSMTPDAVLAALDALPGGWDAASLTGGEPTLYDSLGFVVRGLEARGKGAVVETNGLVWRPWLAERNVVVSCSPKLPGSGQDSPLRREKVRAVVARLHDAAAAHYFKFVVTGQRDLDDLLPYCHEAGIHPDGLHADLCYLQPDGYVQPLDRYLAQLRWLQESAPPGFRVTPQVHRLVHGPDARGV